MRPLIPVILCGGSGTRLWPLSRASYPKQYWALNSNDKETLLQQTQQRLKKLKEITSPLLICHEDHRFIVAEQMRQINVNPNAILLEPTGKNTAPAITIAALKAIEKGEDPLLLILSADHAILKVDKFLDAIQEGKSYAENGQLVTFGIVPTSAEIGYGYIESSEQSEKTNTKAFKIKRFVEKPDKDTAKKFIADKRFTWNSGMFLFKSSVILSELEKHLPEVVENCKQALSNETSDLDFLRLDEKSFNKCANISIDVGVMEKTNLGTVIKLDAGWSDIGNWNALWETAKKDKNGNVQRGKVILEQTKNSYFRSEHRLIVGLGVKDIVLVETDDAVLVANRNQSQKVKSVVKKLEEQQRGEAKAHKKIYRPWGQYTSVDEGNLWQVKRIEVKPGASLSLQMHHHRAEHWVVVKGTALVERDGKEELLVENQSTYIPLGCIHRLSNPGKVTLELIEVQSGDYIGEDDIVRLEDRYGRVVNNK